MAIFVYMVFFLKSQLWPRQNNKFENIDLAFYEFHVSQWHCTISMSERHYLSMKFICPIDLNTWWFYCLDDICSCHLSSMWQASQSFPNLVFTHHVKCGENTSAGVSSTCCTWICDCITPYRYSLKLCIWWCVFGVVHIQGCFCILWT